MRNNNRSFGYIVRISNQFDAERVTFRNISGGYGVIIAFKIESGIE